MQIEFRFFNPKIKFENITEDTNFIFSKSFFQMYGHGTGSRRASVNDLDAANAALKNEPTETQVEVLQLVGLQTPR